MSLNAAIECVCKTVIAYDSLRMARIRCPKCQREWFQSPPMFSDDGIEAKKLPYIFATIGGDITDDDSATKYVDELKKANAEAKKLAAGLGSAWPHRELPERVAFVFAESEPVIVEL